MKLQENLIRLRKQKGLSQEELAYQLGISRQSVSKWESGTSVPELERLVEISELYGVSLDELVKGENSVVQGMVITDEQLQRVIRKTREYEYKSRLKIGNLPLVHINFGYGKKVAKGIIAIGNIAIGVLSLGGLSLGVLSLGGIGMGLLSIGGLAIGGLCFGGLGIGYMAVGGLAIGIYACGGLAIGQTLAIGGKAIGHIAIGASATGKYCLEGSNISGREILLFLRTIPESLPNWLFNALTSSSFSIMKIKGAVTSK